MSVCTPRLNAVAGQKPGMVFSEATLRSEIDPDMIRCSGTLPVASS